MLEQLKRVYQYREMLRNIVLRELRGRYRGSVLGFLWTFVNPLLMLVIYSLVFSFILKTQIENYPMFIFVALLPWNFFVNSIMQGTASLVQNAGLIKKIYFPREIFPLATVISNLVNYVLSLIILIPALLISGIAIKLVVIAFPIVLIINFLFVISIVLVASVINVYFRDSEHLIGILLMALFYLTPVLFPLDLIPERMQWLFQLNPVGPLINSYRDIFFYGIWPDWSYLLKLGCAGIVLFILSLKLFDHYQKDVAEHI
jgi:lipopolysaccharide transport system permease protein